MSLKLNNDPFYCLDSFQDESIVWANEILQNINTSKLSEFDIQIVSLSLATIFNGFLHFTKGDYFDVFDSYIEDYFSECPDLVLEKINACTAQIASLMHEAYKDPIKIYHTFENKIEPNGLNFESQLNGFAFVNEKFNW